MKTTYNERPTLKELNLKSDKGLFTHKILRVKLIAESHYNPNKHTKGKFYFEDGMLWCAYAGVKNEPCYAPMFSIPNRNEKN